MTLNEWFTKGLTERTYVQKMEKNQGNLLTVYNQHSIHQREKEVLHRLQKKKLRALVITADWCGDAMVNIPIFMRIANEALIDARYFIRDENLELMDQYLTNGTARSIPIIVLIDQEGNEVGKWGPRSLEAQRFVDEKKPEKEASDYEEAFQRFAKEAAQFYTTDRHLWKDIEKEIVEVLAKI
ncbi:thioredoxin family protein [Bacillus sp. NPDC077027]|uniref:thioredoxin family protein n=1 Tax=Bacillus sp. NPDC077027 TaxID=3390548 RepID=UPI003D07A389